MSPQLQGHLAMLSFSALVAGSFALGALVANDITPAAFNALRFCAAVPLVGVLMWLTKAYRPAAIAAPWRYLVLGGLFTFYFVLMFEGLKTAAPVSAAAVFTLVPLMAAGFAWLILRQTTTPRMAVALTIGGIGAIWVIFRADLSALLAFDVGRGEWIYFIGCISHALYTPMVRRLNRGESAVAFAFFTILAGSVILLVYSWSDLRVIVWTALPPLVWLTLAYVTVFATAMTIVLLQFATLRLPAAKVMAYTYLTPSWVIVWGVFLGDGTPPWLVLGGVLMTILAVFLLLRDDTGETAKLS
jgi:drug/metabolite transporter (DMT)-like permease